RRSFDDLLEVVQTYYKTATAKKLFHELLLVDIKNKKGEQLYFYPTNCSGIKRITMLFYTGPVSYKLPTSNKYDSKYSWIELFEMLNIKSIVEMYEYKEKYKKNEKI